MDCFIKYVKIKLPLIISLIIVFSFLGCSQGLPEVINTDCTVVFSYDNYDSLPDVRLSVFVQAQSDVRRCERIRIHSIDSNYIWETNNLKRIASDDFMWAGNVNFVVPGSEKLPSGNYDITYINSDGEEVHSYANVKYNEKLYTVKANDINSFTTGENWILNMAIYDSDNLLLYFGEKTEDFYDKDYILNYYYSASDYQDIWITSDNSVMCILPKQEL